MARSALSSLGASSTLVLKKHHVQMNRHEMDLDSPERLNWSDFMDIKALLFSAAIALLFVTANILTKKSLDEGCAWLTVVVSLLAVLGFAAFRILCKNYGLAVASGVVDAMLTILTILFAIVIFKESLNFRQYCGIAILLIGLQLVR